MRGAVTVLALSCLACAARAHAALDSAPFVLSQPVVLPLLPDVVLPLVVLRLDGAELTFLVDSGAERSFVEPRRAAELGLELRPSAGRMTTSGTGGNPVVIDRCVPLEVLELGALRLEHVALPALDDDVLRTGHFSGVLGQDLLARLVLVVDMERHALHLLPATERAGIQAYLREAELGDGAWAAIPSEPRPSPFLPLDTHGARTEPVGVEIDTGATDTSFPERLIAALALAPSESDPVERRGVGGTRTAQAYRLEDFGLFGFRVTYEIYSNPLDYGLLGMDLLGEFVFVLDGPGRTFWLHHREVVPDLTALPSAGR